MKRLIILLIASFFTLIVSAQTSVYGLIFGESYSLKELESHVSKAAGIKYSIKETRDKEMLTLPDSLQQIATVFGIVDQCEIKLVPIDPSIDRPEITVGMDSDSVLSNLTLVYEGETPEIDKKYSSLVDSLSRQYNLEKRNEEDPNYLSCIDNEAMIGISITKNHEYNFILLIITDWSKPSKRVSTLIDALTPKPDIQDKFLGLKLGKAYSMPSIKSGIVMRSGKYFNTEPSSDGYIVKFTDVSFGGTLWDYCDVYTVKEFNTYRFYQIEFKNSIREEGYTEAFDIYKSYVNALDTKYGEGRDGMNNIIEESHRYYIGGNDVSIDLFIFKARALSGKNRWFTGMSYFKPSIMKQNINKANDEL